MLVATQLIPHIKGCLAQGPKCNLIPLHFPYLLENDRRDVNITPGYKFVADAKYSSYDYIWHVTILLAATAFTLYIAIFEDTEILEIVTHICFLLVAFVYSYYSFIQKLESKAIAGFLNELLNFETRWLVATHTWAARKKRLEKG